MKPIGACIFVVYFLMIFASLVRFYVFAMPPGGSKMLAVDVSIEPYQWLGRSPSHHEVLTPVQLLPRLQNHHNHTQAARTTTLRTSLAMDQEEKKQVQSIRDQLKGHSLPDGGKILGSINLSSSEFTATNNRAHIVRQYESGSTASERKSTRETPDRKGSTFSLFSLEDLRQYFVNKLIDVVSNVVRKLLMVYVLLHLLAIVIFCSKESPHLCVRSSTQPPASQRILLSLSDDFAATIDNSPYEKTRKPQYYPLPYKETRKPQYYPPYEETGKPQYLPYIKPVPPPPPKAPEKPKEPEKPKLPPRGQVKQKLPPRRGQVKWIVSENLQQYFGHTRKDVAAYFGVSVSTFKRMCRQQGITQWQNRMGSSGSVSKPPDQHGERNASTARETPSHNVQTGMEGELFGQNEVANVFRRDFMGGPIALNTSTARETPSHNVQTGMEGEPVGQNQESNECQQDFMERQFALNTESGLIMVSRPPDQHGEMNTSTACERPSHNVQTGMKGELFGQNEVANVFRRDFMGGPIALNRESGLIMVSRPPDQHGERNTSTSCETPSHNVETRMEGELFGQNEVANVFRRDFMGGPIALNRESGLIMVLRPPDQHGERNTSIACRTPSCNVETGMEVELVGQNQEANVFRRDFTEGPTALNTENGLIIGSSSQVNDQSTLSTPYQNHNALVFPQPRIRSMLSENRGGSIDWRNSLASQAEPFSDRHISGSINLAFPTWLDQAAPSQHAEGHSVQSTVYPYHNAVHHFPEGHSRDPLDQLEGQTMQFPAHPNPNALGLPQFQIASSQVPSANEDRIASQVESFFMGHVSESSNLAFPEYSDAAAPIHPVATILTERQDTRSVKVKATYGDSIIKFQLPLTSGIKELMQEVSKAPDCELGSFDVYYKDEDGDWILMTRDYNVSEYLQLLNSLGNQATKLKVRKKVPNTTNICETC
ncbi:hypothetical protein RHMOL_Rhmol05G0027600 [Rhododendron molle]|uniref:Uncharacterized protein n=1 Tax=Rhododendron molle TaxID=49168 RepID=A0ACC0NKN5_RHOML|nr:hypothetical protein RHMOL_Rhmol05G0027600 [Rhododendron molle]